MAQDDSADAVAAAECQHLVVTSPPPNPKTTREGCSILLDINNDNALQAIEKESITEESRDNRLLIDNNTAQNLSSDDIDALRRNGATGDEIVEALISNSATFEKKTVYSQEKYKRKKQKKYAPTVLLRKPSARSICETYFKKFPARVGFLRVDTLSLLLSMANAGAHSDVLVVDMIGGMVTGAVAERLGGTGYVCSTYFGVTPYPSDIVRMFNFNGEVYNRIVHVPVSDLSKSLDDFVPSKGRQAPLETMKQWKTNGFCGLIIAAPESEVVTIVHKLLPFLAYSAPFAIYHQYLQPLATCMHKLQTSKLAISLQISEPWLREYQVLPSRAHPLMQMSSFGGYILSGIRIRNNIPGSI